MSYLWNAVAYGEKKIQEHIQGVIPAVQVSLVPCQESPALNLKAPRLLVTGSLFWADQLWVLMRTQSSGSFTAGPDMRHQQEQKSQEGRAGGYLGSKSLGSIWFSWKTLLNLCISGFPHSPVKFYFIGAVYLNIEESISDIAKEELPPLFYDICYFPARHKRVE